MNFKKVYTQSGYIFYLKLMGNKYIIKENPNIDYTVDKSLTNNINEVLCHILAGLYFGNQKLPEEIKFYQLDNEGIFNLNFSIVNEPHSYYPLDVINVEWKFITKNINHFTILYGEKNA